MMTPRRLGVGGDFKEDVRMSEDSIVKTEIKLSEESVQKIITAKVAEVLMGQTELVETFVDKVLHHRDKKEYSRDPPKPTLFEEILEASLKPIVVDELKRQFEKKYKKTFQKAVEKGLAKIFSGEETTVMDTILKGMTDAFSKFHFYIRS